MANIYRQLNMRMLNPFEFARMAWPQAARSVAPSARAARSPIPGKPFARVEQVFQAARVVTTPSPPETYYLGDGRGFAGLGEEVPAQLSSQEARAKVNSLEALLRSHEERLRHAQRERALCDQWNAGDVIGAAAGLITFGISTVGVIGGKVSCIATWDGQIGHFKDQISKTQQAITIARAEVENALAAEAAPPPRDVRKFRKQEFQQRRDGGGGVVDDDAGLLSWLLPVGLGVAAVGVGYFVLRRRR